TPVTSPPEPVSALPRDYVGRSGAPVLGPPLPGDLGRPMVASGAVGRAETIEDAPPGAPLVAPDARVNPAVRIRQAARTSGLFVAEPRDRPATSSGAPPGTPVISAATEPVADPRLVSPERLQAPASPYVLQAGAVIPAALVTGLRSDLKGLAIAQVTRDVHDTLGGGHLLIPAGARLIGAYDTAVAAGQTRLSVTWTRLILPSGRSIVLDDLPGADAAGMAGLRDDVDRHGRAVLTAAGLSTLLAIGAEAGDSDESDLARAVRRGAASSVGEVGRQAVGAALARRPTLTIRPGAPLRVLVTRDLVLEPYVERNMP
uniref:TrbI/VirB10 family protein n=1 Tax=Caulobacter sp. SSI4214 TaxID=2575739 RepID=UPI00143906D1